MTIAFAGAAGLAGAQERTPYAGAPAACPAVRPFAGTWPANLRCYYDAADNLGHWAGVHTVTRSYDNFWTGPKSESRDRVVVGYPDVLLKQRKYNEWVRENPGLKTSDPKQASDFGRPGNGGAWHLPMALQETGRLTMGTLLIPYYKSRLSYDELYATFIARCALVEGRSEHAGHPCSTRRDGAAMSSEWLPRYPDADMAEWGRALEALAQARMELYSRVAAIGVFGKSADWDPLDCFGVNDRRDCSIERLSPEDAAALEGLTRSLAAKISRVREIEEARAADPEVKLGTPVEWVQTGGGFELSKSLVTVEQYAECVRAGQCTEPVLGPRMSGGCNWEALGTAQAAVNCVSWRQANEYARFKRARLPSPQEHEYAATNGGRTLYPWGNEYSHRIYIADLQSRAPSEGAANVCSSVMSHSEAGICDLLTNNFGQWSAEVGVAGDLDFPIVMGQVDLYATHSHSNPNRGRLVMLGRKKNFGSAPSGMIGFRLARSAR